MHAPGKTTLNPAGIGTREQPDSSLLNIHHGQRGCGQGLPAGSCPVVIAGGCEYPGHSFSTQTASSQFFSGCLRIPDEPETPVRIVFIPVPQVHNRGRPDPRHSGSAQTCWKISPCCKTGSNYRGFVPDPDLQAQGKRDEGSARIYGVRACAAGTLHGYRRGT